MTESDKVLSIDDMVNHILASPSDVSLIGTILPQDKQGSLYDRKLMIKYNGKSGPVPLDVDLLRFYQDKNPHKIASVTTNTPDSLKNRELILINGEGSLLSLYDIETVGLNRNKLEEFYRTNHPIRACYRRAIDTIGNVDYGWSEKLSEYRIIIDANILHAKAKAVLLFQEHIMSHIPFLKK